MHPSPKFRPSSEVELIDFIKARAFGAFTVNGPSAPLVSHIPFTLSEDGARIEAHFLRSTPLARAVQERPQEAVLIVSGPDAYISPDWYEVAQQVPTWNYIAAHISGRLEARPADELRGVLERLSAHMEARLAPKPPWKIDKMSADIYDRMARQIIPVSLHIERIEGTWKLSQNKPEDVANRAADRLAEAAQRADIGQEAQVIAKHTRRGES